MKHLRVNRNNKAINPSVVQKAVKKKLNVTVSCIKNITTVIIITKILLKKFYAVLLNFVFLVIPNENS